MGWLLFEALRGLGTSLVSLADIVCGNCLAPGTSWQNSVVCVITNTPAATWNNATENVKANTNEIYAQAECSHNFGRGDAASLVWSTVKESQFLSFLNHLKAITSFLLCGPCLFNLLVKFVSFRLQEFEVRLMTAQGNQPIPEGGPGPYRSFKQLAREFYTFRVGKGLQSLQQGEETFDSLIP